MLTVNSLIKGDIMTEKKCDPCNQNCGQSGQCPARLAWEASLKAARLAARQVAKEPTDKYQRNTFLLACLASVMVWVFVIGLVHIIFK